MNRRTRRARRAGRKFDRRFRGWTADQEEKSFNTKATKVRHEEREEKKRLKHGGTEKHGEIQGKQDEDEEYEYE